MSCVLEVRESVYKLHKRPLLIIIYMRYLSLLLIACKDALSRQLRAFLILRNILMLFGVKFS